MALGAPSPWLLDQRLEMHSLRPGTGEGTQLALPEHRHGWECVRTCVHEACTSMHTGHPARLSAQPPPEQPQGFSPSPWALLIPLPQTPNQQTAPEAPFLGPGSQFWHSAPEPSLPQTSTLGAR